MTDQARLLDESLLRKLERLRFAVTRVRAGQVKGERRSTKRGTSVEFADYRDYTRGDDLRRVDWNVYARLERPYVKLFEEEEDLAVHLLLDASGSMNWPEDAPQESKFHLARKLVAALGHIALSSGDKLIVSRVGQDGILSDNTLQLRGRGNTLRLFDWLAQIEPSGATDLAAWLRDYALAASRPGVCVLVSDLFSPSGHRDGLAALQGRGFEATIIQVLAPDEVEPALAGDLRLTDCETDSPQDVTVDGAMRDLYRRRLRAWQDEIGAYCRSHNVRYVVAQTTRRLDELVLQDLRQAGVIR
jgi:uncharacterized protein (DUF58 family)